MKIAFVTTDSREHFRQFDRPDPYFGTAPQALLEGMAGLPGLEVHVVSCLRQPVTSPEKLAPNIYYHHLLVPRWGWMRTGFQGCVRAVRRKLQQLRPDLVHGQGTELDCALDAVFSGFPNIVTVHGNMRRIARVTQARPFSFGWISARLEGLALRRTQGVICISHHTRTEVEGVARRTWVVPNAVDTTFFDVARDPSSPPAVVCVANVGVIKNQNRLIRALDPVAAEHPLRLILHGAVAAEAPYGAEFLRLVRERPWCDYRGFGDRPTIRRLLGQAGVLVLPSIEENCPMVILEAMAAGVPVVASRVGGIPDLIEDGVSGLLVEPADPASLTQAMRRLLADPAAAARIAAQAKQRAQERFQPRTIAQRHLEIYREVLAGSSSAKPPPAP
jgi:glycosyltransferase involved in cell wall biosynthesis